VTVTGRHSEAMLSHYHRYAVKHRDLFSKFLTLHFVRRVRKIAKSDCYLRHVLRLSVCASLCLSVRLSVCLSVRLSVCLSFCASVCLPDCASVCLSAWNDFSKISLLLHSQLFRHHNV
jgi:hypothetical protein